MTSTAHNNPVTVPRAPLSLLMATGAVIFIANAGLLVLQLLAGRYLAPFIGSSVETWTSVIGVFLTGIALGNWIGGRVADRYPSTRTLALLMVLGGLTCLTPIGGMLLCQATQFHSSIPLGPRIPVLAALFCLLPATVLSMITPMVIKLAMADVRRAGRVSGIAFSLGTLGCLLGNYLTGFHLMAEFKLDHISIGVSVWLVVVGILQAFVIQAEAPGTSAAPESRSDVFASPLQKQRNPSIPLTKPIETEVGLNLRDNIARAYLIVFLCSFCGMSLELTGSRVLAPILGVSLYSWTGIIGVMLAGTAAGNYLGGVMADRGIGAALSRFAFIACGLIGVFGAAPTYQFIYQEYLKEEVEFSDRAIWLVRFGGLVLGIAVAALGVFLSRFTPGRLLNYIAVGGFVGAVLAHTLARNIGRLLLNPDFTPESEVGKMLRQLAVNGELTANQSWMVHGTGFLVGGILLALLAPRSNPKATRMDGVTVLSMSQLLGSLTIVGIVLTLGILTRFEFMTSLPLVERIIAWTFALFFMPMLMLGTISPQVIRLAVKDTQHAGRTAGSIYAWSTAGAIAGTFATGYFLIGSVGTIRVLLIVAFVVAVLAFFVGKLWKNNVMLFAGSIVIGAATIGFYIKGFKVTGQDYEMETKYYALSIVEKKKDGRDVAYLKLDLLTHSYVDLKDPTFLGYKHEEVQGEFLRLAQQRAKQAGSPTNLLVIGGGGYTFPRWVETLLPEVNVEVVEIDPGVTEIAHRRLGLPRDTRIRSIHMDGRQYVAERAPKAKYQLVVQDAVNDLSVPYHLLTKEYNEAIKSLLTPDGIYMLTLIDELPTGKLWRAAAHTMRESFAHVYLLAPDAMWDYKGRGVYILYGSMQPLNLDAARTNLVKQRNALCAVGGAALRPVYPERTLVTADILPVLRLSRNALGAVGGATILDVPPWTNVMEEEWFELLLARLPKMVLTDQYAPVDNLMGDVFKAR